MVAARPPLLTSLAGWGGRCRSGPVAGLAAAGCSPQRREMLPPDPAAPWLDLGVARWRRLFCAGSEVGAGRQRRRSCLVTAARRAWALIYDMLLLVPSLCSRWRRWLWPLAGAILRWGGDVWSALPGGPGWPRRQLLVGLGASSSSSPCHCSSVAVVAR